MIAMFAAVLILVFVPWLDTSRVRLGEVPSVLQDRVMVLRVYLRRVGLARFQAGRTTLRVLVAVLHDRLLRVLPGGAAGSGTDRDTTSAARSITESVLGKVTGGGAQVPVGAGCRARETLTRTEP